MHVISRYFTEVGPVTALRALRSLAKRRELNDPDCPRLVDSHRGCIRSRRWRPISWRGSWSRFHPVNDPTCAVLV